MQLRTYISTHLGRGADALRIIRSRNTWTRNLRKVHHRIIPKNLALRGVRRHDVEVVGVTVLVAATIHPHLASVQETV